MVKTKLAGATKQQPFRPPPQDGDDGEEANQHQALWLQNPGPSLFLSPESQKAAESMKYARYTSDKYK